MKIVVFISVCIGALMMSVAWVDNTSPVATTHPLQFVIPKGWPQPVYDLKNNPPTQEGFDLGKKLFYDGRLSKDGNFPCASCHQQFSAFATYDHPVSHGYNGHFSKRNAPPLFNLAWQQNFMWDGGINHLDLQPLAPITDTNEMAEDINNVLLKLRKDSVYKRMFKAAFGDEQITTQRMTKALSQFLVMMISSNSKYDRVMRGEDSFSLPQRLGYDIYKKKCASCHTEPMFTNYNYVNVGMPVDSFLFDYGRMRITHNPDDSLKFKVPTLRNVQLTAPYGHDGRFYYLYDVLNFFRTKTVDSPTTDSSFKHHLPLSNYEIGQLTAFMYTLTDSTLLNDPRFAPPGYEHRTQRPPAVDTHTYKVN